MRARPLSSHRNMGGTIWQNWRFPNRKIEFGLPFYITYTNSGGDVDENGYFAQVKRILHWTAGGDVDENGCFTYVKRILHWTAGGPRVQKALFRKQFRKQCKVKTCFRKYSTARNCRVSFLQLFSVYNQESSLNLNKRIYFLKRVRDDSGPGQKYFRFLTRNTYLLWREIYF